MQVLSTPFQTFVIHYTELKEDKLENIILKIIPLLQVTLQEMSVVSELNAKCNVFMDACL